MPQHSAFAPKREPGLPQYVLADVGTIEESQNIQGRDQRNYPQVHFTNDFPFGVGKDIWVG